MPELWRHLWVPTAKVLPVTGTFSAHMACVKHTASFTAACTKDFSTEDSQKNLQNFLSIFLKV